MSADNNEMLRIRAKAQRALDAVLAQKPAEAVKHLQDIMHGDIQDEFDSLKDAIDATFFNRGFKALCQKAKARAMYIYLQPTGIIGQFKITVGGDNALVRDFAPSVTGRLDALAQEGERTRGLLN